MRGLTTPASLPCQKQQKQQINKNRQNEYGAPEIRQGKQTNKIHVNSKPKNRPNTKLQNKNNVNKKQIKTNEQYNNERPLD
jgi:hypothetical protein